MSNHPGVGQTLGLLENLKVIVRDFSARERRLIEESSIRINALHRRRDAATNGATTQLLAESQRAESAFQAGKEMAASNFDRRRSRIIRAQKTVRKKTLEAIETREGSRKHRLQTELLQSKRNRESGLASTETALVEYKGVLAAEHEATIVFGKKLRRSFKGYRSFLRLLSGVRDTSTLNLNRDEHELLEELREYLSKSAHALRRFRRLPLPALFRYLPFWPVLALFPIPLVPILRSFGVNSISFPMAIASAVGLEIAGFILHYLGKLQAESRARVAADSFVIAQKLLEACIQKSEARYAHEVGRIESEFESKNHWIEQEWNRAVDEAAVDRENAPGQIDEKVSRVAARNLELHQQRQERRERDLANFMRQLTSETEARKKAFAASCEEMEAKVRAESGEQWRLLEMEWKSKVEPIYGTIDRANSDAEKLFPPWQTELWENWAAPAQFADAGKFARLAVDVEKLAAGLPRDPRLALPGPARFSLPLLLTYPDQGSILFETPGPGRDEIIGALNNIILRLLSTAPAGRLSFTIIDPIGLGQSFSGVMHLADYAEHLINSRIWTQAAQIEERLADLNEHMEKVIQMYLRNEYATIAEYNEQAGNIAERYHFVVVADFPANFTDTAARRLLRIAASGARCGVFTLIHWDHRQALPQELVPEELQKNAVGVTRKGNDFVFTGGSFPGTHLTLDTPSAPDMAIQFIQKVGLLSRDSNRIEVPFAQIAPPESEMWSLDTTAELRVPIGRTGATKLQYLAIGKGTRQHALLAGKTGSGKSTLFHVIITNLALRGSPEQVEFYLIDFKKGVEFKCYATHHLPHARVIAIESDREFGLSVLQRLDDELKRRGDLFRGLGVQDIAGYKRAGGSEPMPRSLLIIDEFQEFFVEDDKISQTASLLLDRIVRQGRAFGIHVLLGSQTLGGAYTVARTTLGQMVIRIALQCNETDAYLIMDDNNPAPRLLSRPGEGIYNDTAGTVEGNSPFQAVWLPEDVRDNYLRQIRHRADRVEKGSPPPIVFEGNAPADVQDNELLRRLLERETIGLAIAPRLWLGAPNSIKGPTEVVFHKQSGNNLLVVGQRDEAILAMLSVGLVALAAQHPPGAVRFILCDASPSGSPQREFIERVIEAIPHPVSLAKQDELAGILSGLEEEFQKRTGDEPPTSAPTTFLLIHGLQRFSKLRYEEDFGFTSGDAAAAPNPATLLNRLICERTRFGFHVIATCDTLNNVNRFLGRQALGEFELRVLFQMSPNDSASLIDSPRAGNLGLHRALLYNEQEGHLETFRPYALPNNDWIQEAGRNLSRLHK